MEDLIACAAARVEACFIHVCLCRVLHTVADGKAAVVQWKLRTGRTHQIRVHAQHIGCPLFGDGSYGGVHHAVSKIGRGHAERCDFQSNSVRRGPIPTDHLQIFHMVPVCREQAIQAALNELGRPALHAKVLGFKHPTSGETMQFDSDIPADLEEVLHKLTRLYN